MSEKLYFNFEPGPTLADGTPAAGSLSLIKEEDYDKNAGGVQYDFKGNIKNNLPEDLLDRLAAVDIGQGLYSIPHEFTEAKITSLFEEYGYALVPCAAQLKKDTNFIDYANAVNEIQQGIKDYMKDVQILRNKIDGREGDVCSGQIKACSEILTMISKILKEN